ncbi:MAG: topoisomerase DNA-binding C4 zinc finger domain-containing protein [Eubacterium sp.]
MPRCGGDVIEKKTKRRTSFYGCSNYPNCHFMTWDLPDRPSLPEVRQIIVQKKGNILYCPDIKGCGYEVAAPKSTK